MLNLSYEDIKNAIDNTKSMAAAAKYLKIGFDTFKRYAIKYNLYNPNQAGKGIDKTQRFKNDVDVFKKYQAVPTTVLKKWLLNYRDWKCEECGISKWQGKPITLEIHHIDGNHYNNELTNLKILCPNCHSQTENWKYKKKDQRYISDEVFIKNLKESKTIKEALMKMDLICGGKNYERAKKLLEKIKETE